MLEARNELVRHSKSFPKDLLNLMLNTVYIRGLMVEEAYPSHKAMFPMKGGGTHTSPHHQVHDEEGSPTDHKSREDHSKNSGGLLFGHC